MWDFRDRTLVSNLEYGRMKILQDLCYMYEKMITYRVYTNIRVLGIDIVVSVHQYRRRSRVAFRANVFEAFIYLDVAVC